MKTTSWTAERDRAIVADYFAALDKLAQGLPVSKAATRRILCAAIGRGEGSVEFKRCNVSAILHERGIAWWPGYRPEAGANYARGLVMAVESELAARNAAAAA